MDLCLLRAWSLSLQANIGAGAAGREHVEVLHRHREKLCRNVAAGQSWAGTEALPAQTETPGAGLGDASTLCARAGPVGGLL